MSTTAAKRCRRRFLRFFPNGFADETYLDWARNYKADAHAAWCDQLNRATFRALLAGDDFIGIAARAIRIESRTNLLFSFEKMALRDAVRTTDGARTLAVGLYDVLHGGGRMQRRFEKWCENKSLLELAERFRTDLGDLHPRDMIDLQSFLWVQGSDEYRGRTFQAAHTTSLIRAS